MDGRLMRQFFHDESGASAVEYGLLVGLIAIVILGAVTALGTSLQTIFSSMASTIAALPTS